MKARTVQNADQATMPTKARRSVNTVQVVVMVIGMATHPVMMSRIKKAVRDVRTIQHGVGMRRKQGHWDRCTCGCGWSVHHSTLQRHVWTTGVLMALSKATSTFQCQDFAKQCTRRRLCQRWFVANTNLRRGTQVQAEETMSDKMSAPWLGWCGRRC